MIQNKVFCRTFTDDEKRLYNFALQTDVKLLNIVKINLIFWKFIKFDLVGTDVNKVKFSALWYYR